MIRLRTSPGRVVSAWMLTAIVVVGAGRGVAQQEEPKGTPREEIVTATSPITKAEVFFVTNRRLKGGDEARVRFTGKRGESTVGTCEVEFEPIPVLEQVADRFQFYIPAERKSLSTEMESDRSRFWERLAAAAAASRSGDVLVFIHGYSYDFERACDRAAEAQRVLGDEAVVLMFTWPSNGRPTDYGSDRQDLEWSVPFLQSVLRQLAERVGAEHVQVMAHSLGSKGVVEAVSGLRHEGLSEPLMAQLMLLAPDMDSSEFLERLPALGPLSGDITLYVSSNDTPLKFSRQVNGTPRLGQAGQYLTVVEGVETVDVTPAGRYQYLGHEYFYFHPLVVADLVELVTTRHGAAERQAPRPRDQDGLTYWEIVAEERP